MKSENIEFEITHDGKNFLCDFETECKGVSILMNVICDSYRLSIYDLIHDHEKFYRLIRSEMNKLSDEYWDGLKAEQRTAFDSLPSIAQSVHKNVSLNERYRAINKLGRAIVSLCLCLSLFSCSTTKINKQGDRVETANTRHFKKVHPYGFNAGRNYINYSPKNKTEIR